MAKRDMSSTVKIEHLFEDGISENLIQQYLIQIDNQAEQQSAISFFNWVNQECKRSNIRFCNIFKIEGDCVAFLLTSCRSKNGYSEDMTLDINGYLQSRRHAIAFNFYHAELTYYANESTLEINDNYINNENLHNKGIGSAGLSCIKSLAKQLRCKIIRGKAQMPNINDEAGLKRLLYFYRKNDFIETNTKNHIVTYDCTKN